MHKEQLEDALSDPINTTHAAGKQNSTRDKHSHRGRGKKSKQGNHDKATTKAACEFCGINHSYDRSKYPASGKTCPHCVKQGHFAVKC